MQRLQPTRQPGAGAGIVRNQAKIWISTPLNYLPSSSQGNHGRVSGVCRWFGMPRTGKNAPRANLTPQCGFRVGRSRDPAVGYMIADSRACLKMPLKRNNYSTRGACTQSGLWPDSGRYCEASLGSVSPGISLCRVIIGMSTSLNYLP